MAPAGRGCCGNPSRSPGSRRAPPPSPGPDRHSGDNASPGRAHTGRVVCPSRDILGKIDGPETTGPRRRHRASGLDLLSSQIGSPPGRRRGQRCHGSSLRRQDTEPQLCPPFVPPAPPDQPPLGFPSVPSHIPLTPPPGTTSRGVSRLASSQAPHKPAPFPAWHRPRFDDRGGSCLSSSHFPLLPSAGRKQAPPPLLQLSRPDQLVAPKAVDVMHTGLGRSECDSEIWWHPSHEFPNGADRPDRSGNAGVATAT